MDEEKEAVNKKYRSLKATYNINPYKYDIYSLGVTFVNLLSLYFNKEEQDSFFYYFNQMRKPVNVTPQNIDELIKEYEYYYDNFLKIVSSQLDMILSKLYLELYQTDILNREVVRDDKTQK